MTAVAEVAGWVGILSLPFFVVWDMWRPRLRFTTPRFWRVHALLVTTAIVAVTVGVGVVWGRVLGEQPPSLFHGRALGTWGGAAVGVLLYELVAYWYHRAAHSWGWLWRIAHQMHHSAEAMEALGANYSHPIDTVAFVSWSILVFYPVLGLSPDAAGVAGAFLAFNSVFQHANIRTPHWLGYLIERPESHGVHHQRGVHRFNYSDLPLWDMAFGTFRNPRTWEEEAGFYNGASTRVVDMLLGRDVSAPAKARARALAS